MALALLLVVLTQRVYGWLFVLGCYAAVAGYKLLKGPYGTAGTITVVVSSILSFLIYMCCEMVYWLQDYFDMSVGEILGYPGDVFSLTFSVENLAESWFQILFFVIGLVIVIVRRPLSQQNVLNEIETMESLNSALNENEQK